MLLGILSVCIIVSPWIFAAPINVNETTPVIDNATDVDETRRESLQRRGLVSTSDIYTIPASDTGYGISAIEVYNQNPRIDLLDGQGLCSNAEFLMKILNLILPLLSSNVSEYVKTSSVLQILKELLGSSPPSTVNAEIMYKVNDLLQLLEKYDVQGLVDDTKNYPLRTLGNSPTEIKPKLDIKYEIPIFDNPNCTAELLAIVKVVHEAISRLVNNPVCKSQVVVPELPQNVIELLSNPALYRYPDLSKSQFLAYLLQKYPSLDSNSFFNLPAPYEQTVLLPRSPDGDYLYSQNSVIPGNKIIIENEDNNLYTPELGPPKYYVSSEKPNLYFIEPSAVPVPEVSPGNKDIDVHISPTAQAEIDISPEIFPGYPDDKPSPQPVDLFESDDGDVIVPVRIDYPGQDVIDDVNYSPEPILIPSYQKPNIIYSTDSVTELPDLIREQNDNPKNVYASDRPLVTTEAINFPAFMTIKRPILSVVVDNIQQKPNSEIEIAVPPSNVLPFVSPEDISKPQWNPDTALNPDAYPTEYKQPVITQRPQGYFRYPNEYVPWNPKYDKAPQHTPIVKGIPEETSPEYNIPHNDDDRKDYEIVKPQNEQPEPNYFINVTPEDRETTISPFYVYPYLPKDQPDGGDLEIPEKTVHVKIAPEGPYYPDNVDKEESSPLIKYPERIDTLHPISPENLLYIDKDYPPAYVYPPGVPPKETEVEILIPKPDYITADYPLDIDYIDQGEVQYMYPQQFPNIDVPTKQPVIAPDDVPIVTYESTPNNEILVIIKDNIRVIENKVPEIYLNAAIQRLINNIKQLINFKQLTIPDYVTIINQYEKLIEYIKHLNINNELLKDLLLSITNPSNLKVSTGKSNVIELTYLVKRPTPVVYQPYYYVKYRLPYISFMTRIEKLLERKPYLKSNPSLLYKELIALSNVAETSPDLEGYGKEDIIKLTFSNGTLLDAKVVKGDNEDMYATLDLLREINSESTLEDVIQLIKHADNVKNIYVNNDEITIVKDKIGDNSELPFQVQSEPLQEVPLKVTSREIIGNILKKLFRLRKYSDDVNPGEYPPFIETDKNYNQSPYLKSSSVGNGPITTSYLEQSADTNLPLLAPGDTPNPTGESEDLAKMKYEVAPNNVDNDIESPQYIENSVSDAIINKQPSLQIYPSSAIGAKLLDATINARLKPTNVQTQPTHGNNVDVQILKNLATQINNDNGGVQIIDANIDGQINYVNDGNQIVDSELSNQVANDNFGVKKIDGNIGGQVVDAKLEQQIINDKYAQRYSPNLEKPSLGYQYNNGYTLGYNGDMTFVNLQNYDASNANLRNEFGEDVRKQSQAYSMGSLKSGDYMNQPNLYEGRQLLQGNMQADGSEGKQNLFYYSEPMKYNTLQRTVGYQYPNFNPNMFGQYQYMLQRRPLQYSYTLPGPVQYSSPMYFAQKSPSIRV